MLYNIISPLIFFGSLSGVIVVVSRVAARNRRTQHTAEVIKTGQASSKQQAAEALRPASKGIKLARNQLAALYQNTKDKFKRQPREAKVTEPINSPQTIIAPRSGFRERATAMGEKLKSASRQGTGSLKVKTQSFFSAAKNWRVQRQAAKSAALAAAQEAALSVPALPPPVVDDSPQILVRSLPKKPAKKQVRSQLVTPTFFKRGQKPDTLRLAQEALSNQRYQEVENILVPYIMKNTKNVQAYMILGQSALKQENWDEAVEIFRQIIVLSPQEPGAQGFLGQAIFRVGHYGQALPHLQRALDETPEDEEVLQALLKIARTMDNQPLLKSTQAKLLALKSVPAVAAK